tara:strand:- start:29 stop:700 length:672 start_codon:yes stop_codon:yes gene_type:complete
MKRKQITLEVFQNAAFNSGGEFGVIKGYTDKTGRKSDVLIRIGESYPATLRRCIKEAMNDLILDADTMIPKSHLYSEWCEKHDATPDDFREGLRETIQSWRDSLEGKQPKRKRNTVAMSHTKGRIEVASVSADGLSINISVVRVRSDYSNYEEHNKAIDQSAPRKKPKSGKARIKDAIRRKYQDKRTFSLNAETFDRLSMRGLTITPDQISPMLEEWEAKRTA